MDNQTTIGRLFGEDMISFIIPSYQRAYSWRVGKDGRIGQVEMYLNDIIDQPDCSNYFLGHYLFEKTPRNRYELIDGQQRLTTTVIFMSCLVKELRKRGIERFEYNNIQYATEQIYERYLQPRYGNQKFETLPEDSSFFNRVIIKCDGDYNKIETGRKSEQRIREAILFFEKKMSATTKDTGRRPSSRKYWTGTVQSDKRYRSRRAVITGRTLAQTQEEETKEERIRIVVRPFPFKLFMNIKITGI